MKNSSYHAHEVNKTIKCMAMIYILPSPAKSLEILHHPSGKFEILIKKAAAFKLCCSLYLLIVLY
jgi:hypothetical protein